MGDEQNNKINFLYFKADFHLDQLFCSYFTTPLFLATKQKIVFLVFVSLVLRGIRLDSRVQFSARFLSSRRDLHRTSTLDAKTKHKNWILKGSVTLAAR